MSMTAKDILDRAKANWGTALTAQIAAKVAVTMPYAWISDALVALYEKKPYARFSPTTSQRQDFEEITAEADILDIDRKWMLGLSHYVTAMGYYSNSENQDHHAKAGEFMKLFTTFLEI